MFQSYEDIFSQRADAYQKAMELCPTARDREFQLAVEAAEVKSGETVCDSPSGGGYLRAYLPAGVHRYLAVVQLQASPATVRWAKTTASFSHRWIKFQLMTTVSMPV